MTDPDFISEPRVRLTRQQRLDRVDDRLDLIEAQLGEAALRNDFVDTVGLLGVLAEVAAVRLKLALHTTTKE